MGSLATSVIGTDGKKQTLNTLTGQQGNDLQPCDEVTHHVEKSVIMVSLSKI